MRHPGGNRLERSRDAGDLALFIGVVLGVLAVIGSAAYAAWSLSADDERYATTAPGPAQTTAPLNY